MPLPNSGWSLGIGISEGHEQGIQQHAPGRYIIRISANFPYRDEYKDGVIDEVQKRCSAKGWQKPYWIQCQWEHPLDQIQRIQLMGNPPNP